MPRRIAGTSIKVLLTDPWISKYFKLAMMDVLDCCPVVLLLRYNHLLIFVFMITRYCYKLGPVKVFFCDPNEIGIRKTSGPKYNDKHVGDLSTGSHKILRRSPILAILPMRHHNKPFYLACCWYLKRGTVVTHHTFRIDFRNLSRGMAHRCRSVIQDFTRIQIFQEKIFHFLFLSADQICSFMFQNHPT